MEYIDYAYYVVIFIIVVAIFYLLMSNFGIKYDTFNDITKNVQDIKDELNNLKLHVSNTESKQLKQLNQLPDKITVDLPPQPPQIVDPIVNYDIAKLNDPLVDPRGRTSADQIPAPQVAAQLNFPTQGVLDTYHRVGLLIALDDEIQNNRINEAYNEGEFVWNGPSKTRLQIKQEIQKIQETSNKPINKQINGVQVVHVENIEDFAQIDDVNGILELMGKKIACEWYQYFTSITMGNKVIKVNVHNKNRKELYTGDIVYISELNKKYRVQIDEMDMIQYNPYLF